MGKELKRVLVTGGAGQIAYSLLFRIASGELLGRDLEIALHILEIPEAFGALEGVKMELDDCAFPLLKEIHIGSDPLEVFRGVDYAFLVGAKPRGPGMERGELLNENSKIFVTQGKALNEVASANVKVLVVGNPCNTNCLIAIKNAPKIPTHHFHAMMMLDQNRAIAALSSKASVSVNDVSNVAVWGNHSSTQVPDFVHGKILGEPITTKIKDHAWLERDFISGVQKRGAAIIAARGKSSAASAANAAIEAMRAMIYPTKSGEWYSSGILSDQNPYGIEKGIVFSFPCRTLTNGVIEIVDGLELNEFLREKIKITENELIEERNMVFSGGVK